MISVNDLKPGICFELEGDLYTVLILDLNKTAMAKMNVKVKVRNLRSGVIKEINFSNIGVSKVEQITVDRKTMNYLYDNETYEQIEIPHERLEWEMKFLRPNEDVTISMFNNEILGVILPDKVALQITECEQAVKGDTATSASKNAVLETGLEVKVPLFIQSGETILVSTSDGKYCGRA